MTAIQISTFGDLLTDFAEKIGETAQNTDDNRKRKLNNAYQYIANKELWWWLEATDANTTTTSALSYSLPSNFRAFHPRNPVKIGNEWRTLVPYENLQLHDGSSSVVSLPFARSRKFAYIYGSTIYFIQDSMSSGSTITFYYYKTLTALDATSDEPLMPVAFREMISLYAAGMHLKSQGGSESIEGNDYLQLFDSYLADMKAEQDNRRRNGILRRSLDPEEAAIFTT